MRIGVVGGFDETGVAGSLSRAAERMGHTVERFSADRERSDNRWLDAASWRLTRRPLRLRAFSAEIVEACRVSRPATLIATGRSAPDARALLQLRDLGVRTTNFSTDDPWNKALCAPWHLQALPFYATVFTPRHSNLEPLRALGCRDVRYLPFAYDPELSYPRQDDRTEAGPDVLFVGGADADRSGFFHRYGDRGPQVTVVGALWDRHAQPNLHVLGRLSPDAIRDLTSTARINLCLVRRANRDDHVMRTYEMAATGACILAEDTPGHRALFGAEGEAARYFSTPEQAASAARDLLAGGKAARDRMAAAAQHAVAGETYDRRLQEMVAA